MFKLNARVRSLDVSLNESRVEFGRVETEERARLSGRMRLNGRRKSKLHVSTQTPGCMSLGIRYKSKCWLLSHTFHRLP